MAPAVSEAHVSGVDFEQHLLVPVPGDHQNETLQDDATLLALSWLG